MSIFRLSGKQGISDADNVARLSGDDRKVMMEKP